MQSRQMMFVAAGLLLVLLAIPLVRRRVRPNQWYGLRLRATFADEHIWYDANAASGREMVVFGTVFTLVALLLPYAPGMTDSTYSLVCAGLLLIGSLVLTVRGIGLANRLLRQRRKGV
jgi:uncharacterized membrane protein